ncbi:PREDICTED: beta-2 adrenergic receptor-like [Priapulus caudatus]|uniref:Beta-2 adrenergic receptor-like n=1 Tax=Priapulus caudatus TaxID=37621 RepID=A0ABM1DYS8_PRICU|nr:PREDICTED: beta-2 adrenergic receptor-like [Priapulus caudatus]
MSANISNVTTCISCLYWIDANLSGDDASNLSVFSDTSLNETYSPASGKSEPSYVAATRVCIGLVIISLNGIVLLLLIARAQSIPEIKYILIKSLIGSDMLVGVTMLYYGAVNLNQRVGDKISQHCLNYVALICFACMSSTGNMLGIAIDMYIMIIHPLRYYDLMSERRARVMAVIAWMVAGFSIVMIILFGREADPLKQPFPMCSLAATFTFMGLFSGSMVMIYVPLCLMIYLYGSLFIVARRHMKEISALQAIGAQLAEADLTIASGLKKNVKVAITMFLVVATFFVGWLPYFTIILVTKAHPELYYRNQIGLFVFVMYGKAASAVEEFVRIENH